jgi:transcriptional/translational regulatory protein YebC/TACO1
VGGAKVCLVTKLNSRYGKMVTMCIKAGGSDPISNVQLAKLLEQAKQAKAREQPNEIAHCT